MFMEILRNMWRRKFRTFLTVSGIVIGIFAFTVMGSMALKFNKMIDGGKKYITGQITVMPKGTDFMSGASGMLPVDTLNKIAKVEGVEGIEGGVSLAVDEIDPNDPTGGSMMGTPATVYSVDPSSNFVNKNWATMAMREGKYIGKDSDINDIAIGINVATKKKWKVGDEVTIRSQKFYVVGIMEKTMTGPDDYVFMNIAPARELYVLSNPFLKSLREQSKTFDIANVSTSASVSWKNGIDADKLSDTIKEQFKNEVLVLSPKKMGEQIDQASSMFNAVILGSALIALIVGLFSIVNTMVMSISERTKEIGIKKALGASNRTIGWEYTLEAGLIGLLGGSIGLGLGVLTATLINKKMADQGAEIFLLESGFMIGVIIFSFVVGIIAGVIPASRAAKLKVVDAIREM
jgi:putative ABC transport system permease protein